MGIFHGRSRGRLSEGRARRALARAKIQFQGTNRVSPSPHVVVAEAKKKVFRLEKALEVYRDSTGQEVDFLKKAVAKAHEAARKRPLEVQIKECREFVSSEQRFLEADRQAELALLTEGKSRLSRLESQQLEAPRQQPEPGVTELEQRIQALVRECDALRAAATQGCIRKNQSGAQKGAPRWTTFHQCPTMCQMWKGGCRNCELRNALEFGDPGTIEFLGKLVAQGVSKLAVLAEDVPMVKCKFIKTTFIEKFFHQNPHSSKTFIKNNFHQKPLSSKNQRETNFDDSIHTGQMHCCAVFDKRKKKLQAGQHQTNLIKTAQD